jgi:hypothetical protein
MNWATNSFYLSGDAAEKLFSVTFFFCCPENNFRA